MMMTPIAGMPDYTPPSAADLRRLKDDLGYLTGEQMAALAALSSDSDWRKYTSSVNPKPLGRHAAFFLAARLALSDQEMDKVLARMRQLGAVFSLQPVPTKRRGAEQTALAQDERPKESQIVMQVPRAQKIAWVKASQAERKKLVPWLIEQINRACQQNAPAADADALPDQSRANKNGP